MVAPLLEQLSQEYEGKVKFYKVNTEKDPEVSKVFGISSIPTLLFIAPTGNPTVIRGAQPMGSLRKNIERILPGEKTQKSFFSSLFSRLH
jgi:thioredoxin 1